MELTAPQVCSRCRKRRIRCDLQLPSCKNCRAADVECLFWDETLGLSMRCSYLYSLHQKLLSLRRQIQHRTDHLSTAPAHPESGIASTPASEVGHHLTTSDGDDFVPPSRTTYLGPGSSARLIGRLLKSEVDWHVRNKIPLPKRLTREAPSQLAWPPESETSLPVIRDQRKVDIHSLLPLSMQRAIIEHYLKVVAPKYGLLPTEHQALLLSHENPLRWSSLNKNDPSAIAISIVFAISTSMVARDLDPSLASISVRCREDVQKLSQGDLSIIDPKETTRWTCIALGALALCELISPTSDQLWDLLGGAASVLDDLRESYRLGNVSLNGDFQRLECSLLKLESSAMMHFRRPSAFWIMRLPPALRRLSATDPLFNELTVLNHLEDISQKLTAFPQMSEQFFEDLIPSPMRVTLANAEIDTWSATLYTALHPLFTASNVLSGRSLDVNSSRLFHTIARSACAIIDHFCCLNEENRVISIWMAAEQVIECAAVWVLYVVSRHSAQTNSEQVSSIDVGTAMAPLLKVSALLASFAARWKGGAAYLDAWQICIELLWPMLGPPTTDKDG